MKKIIYLLIYLFVSNIHCQEKKETIYLFYDLKEKKKCFKEDGSGNNLKIDFYKKERKKGKIIFHICDEKFLFDPKKQKKDTCSIKSLKNINFTNLDYIKDKYQKGNDFKHHVFKQIIIVEKISETQVVKYFNIYWCCEWIIE